MAIGLYLSGGADSALLLQQMEAPVVCLTVASKERDHNVQASKDIIRWISNNTDVEVLEHYIAIADTEADRPTIRMQAREMLTEVYGIWYWRSGKTRNPDVVLEHHEQRKSDRDTDLKLWNKDQHNPFWDKNKKQLYEIYNKNNILDLWDLTVSCEVSVPPCNNCWWCMERSWAENSCNLSQPVV